jgi:serine/threonine-protein phosphatase PGAM5
MLRLGRYAMPGAAAVVAQLSLPRRRPRCEAAGAPVAAAAEPLPVNAKVEGKVRKERPAYFDPIVPYPEWDGNWDGRLHLRQKSKDGPPAPTRHIILVRHGQYDESSKDDERRVLTDLGRDQAVATGHKLRAVLDASGSPDTEIRIRSSTLTRAKETAALMMPHLPDRTEHLGCDPNLNEGRPAQVIPGKAYSNAVVRADNDRIEEAFRSVFYRSGPREDGALHEYEIVVCHGNVIRYFALRALQLPPEAWLRLCTFNCSVTYLVVRPSGSVSLRALGDIGHLPPELTTFSMHHGLEW